jgi:hypothetical protein
MQAVAPEHPDFGAKMNFCSKATSGGRSPVARRAAALALVCALGLIAACGGGTSQYSTFVPARLLVFGDDASALTQTGRKYGVNALDANNVLDCSQQPLWVQSVAALYGFAFTECNPNAVEPKARMLAAPGARVDDVAAQVEAQVAAGGFRDGDLATMLAGSNDVLDLYTQYPGLSEANLLAEARARGLRLAQVVNRLVGLGVKVVVSDLPDLGLTPYAIAQRATYTDTDRAALLSRLTTAFNERLGVNVVLDGRYVGLVQAQLRWQAIGRSPGSFGLTNITDVVCTAPLPNCTTATLAAGANPAQYLWADDTRLAPGGQTQLATLAVDRARRNPF